MAGIHREYALIKVFGIALFFLSAYIGCTIIKFMLYICIFIFCCGMAWMDMFDFGNENVCTILKMQQKQMPF